MSLDLIEVIRKSITMFILLFCSIIALSFAIERWWFFRTISLDIDNFMAALKKFVDVGKFKEALNSIMSENPKRDNLIKNGQKYLKHHLFKIDGNVCERIIGKCNELIQDRNKHDQKN